MNQFDIDRRLPGSHGPNWCLAGNREVGMAGEFDIPRGHLAGRKNFASHISAAFQGAAKEFLRSKVIELQLEIVQRGGCFVEDSDSQVRVLGSQND